MRFLSLILVVALSFPASLSALPATAPAAVMPGTGERVGIIAAVRGAVKINSQSPVGRVVGSGEPIFLGDEISTDEKGSLQILLLDQTTFSIGPNSAIVIDRFVYDPSTHDGEVRAKVVKGVFRFVTGKIGQKKPNQMAVDLPVGTIGIRGTIVAGESTGNTSMVALLGPGANNNTQHNQGSFSLQNSVGGKVTESVVSKPGFGATISASGELSGPFQVPQADLNRLASAVAPDGGSSDSSSSSSTGSGSTDSGDGDSEGDGESPTQMAGQDTAMAGENSQMMTIVQGTSGTADSELSDVSHEETEEFFEEFYSLFSLLTTYEDLISVTAGEYFYNQIDVPIYDQHGNTVGNYDVWLDIDFSTREVGGGNSRWVINIDDTAFTGSHIIAKNFALEAKQFSSGESGFGIFDYSKVISSGDEADCNPSACTADLQVSFYNGSNGTVAETMDSYAYIENPNTDEYFAGAEGGAPQNAGSAPV